MNTIKLIGELDRLLQDEDLTDEKMRNAFEGLLPNLSDCLNGCSAIADGIGLIAGERGEQIREHGYTLKHDSINNPNKELLIAAIWTLLLLENTTEAEYWKPEWKEKYLNKIEKKDRIGKLIIAGALIAAEIDRLKALG